MTNQEFNAYVYEQKRQGRSESQIARSLGMSLAHFMGRINGVDVDKVDPPKQEAPKVEKKPEVKSVSGVKPPEKPKKEEKKPEPKKEERTEKSSEDLSWMND
jgi:hypothetical protein